MGYLQSRPLLSVIISLVDKQTASPKMYTGYTPSMNRDEVQLNRLMSRAKFDDSGCLIWQGAKLKPYKRKTPLPYGLYNQSLPGGKRKLVYAHRLSHELNIGPIPSDMIVCHSCDRPDCINPEHLFLGTHQDNMNDCIAKGRKPVGSNSGNAKLTEADVEHMRSNYVAYSRKFGLTAFARLYGINNKTAESAIFGVTWKHVKTPCPEKVRG